LERSLSRALAEELDEIKLEEKSSTVLASALGVLFLMDCSHACVRRVRDVLDLALKVFPDVVHVPTLFLVRERSPAALLAGELQLKGDPGSFLKIITQALDRDRDRSPTPRPREGSAELRAHFRFSPRADPKVHMLSGDTFELSNNEGSVEVVRKRRTEAEANVALLSARVEHAQRWLAECSAPPLQNATLAMKPMDAQAGWNCNFFTACVGAGEHFDMLKWRVQYLSEGGAAVGTPKGRTRLLPEYSSAWPAS